MADQLKSLPRTARQLYEFSSTKIPNALTQQELLDGVGGSVSVNNLSSALNLLLSKRLLEALQQGNTLVYRAVPLEEAKTVSTMEGDEQIVYDFIKNAGNEGIWTKTLTLRTNLHVHVVNRCLKALESKNLVKPIKSVKNPTRKIYMLYDLVPSSELTGGPWFTDQELDVEFIENLKKVVYRFIHAKSFPPKKNATGPDMIWSPEYNGFPTALQIHTWLRNTNITEVELSLGNVISLVDVLIYDGKVEKRSDGVSYCSVRPSPDATNAFTEVPCGTCPVADICAVGSRVSPITCEYLDKWLN
ncbi:DNA-directed RNA polymerase III complex subunit Rpc34 [Schizosaccharomyces octosporus yFS286]|uniref:DNA-directed RNA polymerase III subunit RPC6 n=1 Tax=Schizosaccharomyces octosporus (strain yFS286) TaxID=483514 RepID=S9PX04_SCHOY|nr:DNA-directed RNA polymerase III complex subunit Rpc34 [Schizosaccharomyces octosporus yFS286]EPX73576.1 DNA-directed RNA polymerase III complex subunit Rpc34 [Schizosaccharomyces octosporus yFS286]